LIAWGDSNKGIAFKLRFFEERTREGASDIKCAKKGTGIKQEWPAGSESQRTRVSRTERQWKQFPICLIDDGQQGLERGVRVSQRTIVRKPRKAAGIA